MPKLLKRFLSILALAFIVGAGGVYLDWNWKRPIPPGGGRYYFHRVELAVPAFQQQDPQWEDDPLGGVIDNGTVGDAGCAVASVAMIFKSYGINTNPQELN